MRYGVQIKRETNFPTIIMKRIASERGKYGEAYTVADLYRDCLIAYTRSHKTYGTSIACEDCATTTVYVNNVGLEHKVFKALAERHGKTLGELLELAIAYHIGNDIERHKEKYNADQTNDGR